MPDNDFLKRSFDTPTYEGRYLVFVFEKKDPPSISNLSLGGFETLAELESLFLIDPKAGKIRAVQDSDVCAYDYLEVFDMEARQFIDINVLNFPLYN